MSDPETHDFGFGPVPAHRHPDGGGWVAETAYVEETVFVGADAKVYDFARAYDYAKLFDCAELFGSAKLLNHAALFGSAKLYGYAELEGCTRLHETAEAFGNAKLSGSSRLFGSAKASGNARLYGNTILFGNMIVLSPEWIPVAVTDHGHAVVANRIDGEWRIIAGCRDFSLDEAKEHWGSPDYHTPRSGRRCVSAIEHLEREIARREDAR